VREFLYSIIEDNTTQSGKKFDYFIQVLIILSSISFSIDTLPNLSESFRSGLDVFETVTVIIFSLEYILRLYVSKKPLSYMFSFYGIVDILAILPF
jgi:voltage-gated potassium channel